jgi:hypothetical protein
MHFFIGTSELLVLFETQLRREQSMPPSYSGERSPAAIQNSGPKHPAGKGQIQGKILGPFGPTLATLFVHRGFRWLHWTKHAMLSAPLKTKRLKSDRP